MYQGNINNRGERVRIPPPFLIINQIKQMGKRPRIVVKQGGVTSTINQRSETYVELIHAFMREHNCDWKTAQEIQKAELKEARQRRVWDNIKRDMALISKNY